MSTVGYIFQSQQIKTVEYQLMWDKKWANRWMRVKKMGQNNGPKLRDKKMGQFGYNFQTQF